VCRCAKGGLILRQMCLHGAGMLALPVHPDTHVNALVTACIEWVSYPKRTRNARLSMPPCQTQRQSIACLAALVSLVCLVCLAGRTLAHLSPVIAAAIRTSSASALSDTVTTLLTARVLLRGVCKAFCHALSVPSYTVLAHIACALYLTACGNSHQSVEVSSSDTNRSGGIA